MFTEEEIGNGASGSPCSGSSAPAASPPPQEPILHDYHNIEYRDAVLAYDEKVPQLDDSCNAVRRWDGETMKRNPVTGEDVPDDEARIPVRRPARLRDSSARPRVGTARHYRPLTEHGFANAGVLAGRDVGRLESLQLRNDHDKSQALAEEIEKLSPAELAECGSGLRSGTPMLGIVRSNGMRRQGQTRQAFREVAGPPPRGQEWRDLRHFTSPDLWERFNKLPWKKLMYKLFVFVGIAVLFNQAAFAAEGCEQGTFPVRSISGFDLSKPGNLEIAMDALKLDEGNELEFESSSESGHKITKVRTCREYDAAIEQRLLFMTGTQRTPEFLRECKVLRFLKRATAASTSCIEGYKLTKTSSDELPPSLGYVISGEQEEAVDDAERANLSWKRYSPKLEFIVLSPTVLTAAGQGVFDKLEVMGFGDFNHDGIQDMLVWISNHAGGTLVQNDAIVLTRKDKKSIFHMLARIE